MTVYSKKKELYILLIISGAISNIVDRCLFGFVIDFIDINYMNYHWFIFNAADIFISYGCIRLLYLRFYRKT